MRTNHNFRSVIDDDSFTPPSDHTMLSANKRGYMKIPEDQRVQLLRIIQEEQLTIKTAARRLGVNYSTAKNIVKIFRQEKRVTILPKKAWKQSENEAPEPEGDNRSEREDGPALKRFVAKKTVLDLETTNLPSTSVSPLLAPKSMSLPDVEPRNEVIQFNFSCYSPLIINRYFIGIPHELKR